MMLTGNISAMTPRWIEPIDLDPEVRAYVTGRGETHESPYSGFNPCHYTGDDEAHVAASRKALADYLEIAENHIVLPRQTHSTECRVITEVPVDASVLEGVDALVTRLPGVAIGVSTADCVPVLLVEPYAKIIAAAHAGWRGAIGGVIENCVNRMIELGANPAAMKAAIGPCICASCFEVGEEVACRFPESCVVRGGAKPHVDLPLYVKQALMECGLPEDVVAMPRSCTRCHPDRYFSARAMGVNSGRNFTFIILK